MTALIALPLALSGVAIIAVLPMWPYSREWGYFPASVLLLVPLFFFLLWVLGVI